MNSCRSIELSACAPPLITFSIGTGSVVARPRRRGSGRAAAPCSAAAAFATASETPRIAFAPSRPLFGVPSSSISVRSSARLVERVQADDRGGGSRSTLATAFEHALAAPRRAAVAQLDRLVHARRGSGGDGGAPERAGLELDVHLDRRVAPRVEDPAALHVLDRARAHRASSLA